MHWEMSIHPEPTGRTPATIAVGWGKPVNAIWICQPKRNMDLPTEAQWEYAARSRGQFLIYGNSTNRWYYDNDSDRNFTSNLLKKPVGSFTPNPLGLYDVMGNGADWVKDWYAADYYSHSPEKDPQGPESGEKKALRGDSGSGHTLSIERNSKKPDNEWGSEFRCAENSPLK